MFINVTIEIKLNEMYYVNNYQYYCGFWVVMVVKFKKKHSSILVLVYFFFFVIRDEKNIFSVRFPDSRTFMYSVADVVEIVIHSSTVLY